MRIVDRTTDQRINSLNLLIETTIGEYYDLSKEILDNNEFQRRRVKSSSTVYSLLKADLKKGCVIPPIVLALSIDNTDSADDQELIRKINNNRKELIILDGLQRTHTIKDLFDELDIKEKEDIKNNKLRLEVYFGIDKLGVLYRMLTLNTGQTPMSSRHQIEIIYSDLLNKDIDGIKLLREVDENVPSILGEYKFSDIIEGFTSYLERDYLTIGRTDILDNIKSLEKLSQENQGTDLFKDFLKTYDRFVKKMVEIGESWGITTDKVIPNDQGEVTLLGQPFAKNTLKVFNKSQVMTGLGSAIGKLQDFNSIEKITDLNSKIDSLSSLTIEKDLNALIIILDRIRTVAKKIGNDQRLFFHFFFRELFDETSDSHLNLSESINGAYQAYQRRTQ